MVTSLNKNFIIYLAFFILLEVVVISNIFNPNQSLIILAIIPVILITITLIAHNHFGVMILIFFQYTNLIDFYFQGAPNHGFKLLFVFIALCWIINRLYRRDFSLKNDPVIILTIVFLIINLISFFYAFDKVQALDLNLMLINQFIIHCIIFINVIKKDEHIISVLWVLTLSLLFSSLAGLYFYFTNPESILQNMLQGRVLRISGFIKNPNDFALLLATLIPIAYYLSLIHKSILTKIFSIGVILTAVIAIILSLSRGVFFTLFITLGYFLFKEKKLKYVFYGLLLLGVSYIFLYAFFPEIESFFINRFVNSFSGKDLSFSQRQLIINGGINMYFDHMIFGVGIGNFLTHSVAYCNVIEVRVAHNTFLEIAAETGIAGILVYCTILIITFIYFFRSQKIFQAAGMKNLLYISRGFEVGLFTLLMGSLFLSEKQYASFFWLSLIIAVILNKKAKQIFKVPIKNSDPK